MPTHSETKEKIMQILKIQGPSIPVRIAKEIKQSILFTSAFLSELLSEKRVKISHMRVGSSPVYFIPSQEIQLEKYIDSIKGKEKEALLLLKDKKFLEDSKQEAAIRVALRSIKDFAIPFQKNEKLYWRYLTNSEEELKEKIKEIPKEEKSSKQQVEKEPIEKEKPKQKVEIFDEKEKPKKKIVKKTARKKNTSKTNEKFFNKVKEFLRSKQIEITEIEGIDKKELIFRVNKNQKEQLLFAYNKKQVKEEDLVKANKKASEMNMKYTLLCLGEQTKKLNNFIDAIKNLDEIEKIE